MKPHPKFEKGTEQQPKQFSRDASGRITGINVLLQSKRTERYERVKVQFILEQAMKAQRGSRKYSPNLALEWGGCSMLHPSCFTPWKETQYPLYRRLGGSQGWSRRVRKILTPLRFDPQTV
jgi:hypothetical protein